MSTALTISIIGSGWLGKPLACTLADQGHAIKLSTTTASKLDELARPGVSPYLLTLSQKDYPSVFFDSDICIINITNKTLADYHKLAESLAASPVANVLFISSSSVYHNNNGYVFEQLPFEDASHPLVKIERLLQANAGFTTTILRFSGLIGGLRHPGRFFAKTNQITDPQAPVNLIHLDDCIGIIESIIKNNVWGEVFNGCADSHPSKQLFYSRARELLTMPPLLFADTTDNPYKIVSNDKIKQQLGYQLIHPDLLQLLDNKDAFS